MLKFIVDKYGHLLQMPDHYRRTDTLRRMGDAIFESTRMVSHCVGMIASTARRVWEQEDAFSGHNKTHLVKWQCITCPDGMITHLWGPSGRRSDAGVAADSRIAERMALWWRFPITDDTVDIHRPADPAAPHAFEFDAPAPFLQYCVYANKGYFNNSNGTILAAHMHLAGDPELPSECQEFNNCMSVPCSSVQWGFQKIVNLWCYLDPHKQTKVWGPPLNMYYVTAALLTNFHNCMYGSDTSTLFRLTPPNIADYLAMKVTEFSIPDAMEY